MMTNKNNLICAGLDCNRDLTTIKSKSMVLHGMLKYPKENI